MTADNDHDNGDRCLCGWCLNAPHALRQQLLALARADHLSAALSMGLAPAYRLIASGQIRAAHDYLDSCARRYQRSADPDPTYLQDVEEIEREYRRNDAILGGADDAEVLAAMYRVSAP